LPIDHDLLERLIKAIGYPGLFAMVFAESGLLIGILLPGDSLLFTAGLLASQGFFNIWVLVAVMVVAAITGDSAGYYFGRRVGRRLFERPDSRFFKRRHLEATEAFYQKHGGKTIIIARFMPIVRTLAPIVAGTADMNYRRFLMFNVAGGFIWGAGITIMGYGLGSAIPDIDKYLIPIVALVIFISVFPGLMHVASDRRAAMRARRQQRASSLPGRPVVEESGRGEGM
jgi:membrane-associated protein